VRVGPGDQREDGLAALTGAVGNLLGVKLTVQARGGVRRTVGVLELADPESRTFTAEDADLVSVVAPQLGRAVQLGRTRAENERHGRLAALGQMLGGIVHDLSSPMSVISGYAELMARENDASARERYRGQVIGELDHVNVMIREVLAFLRGDSQLLVRRNLLPPFFEELTASLQRELQPHQVSLEVALEYSGAARFDAGKLKRLLTNLARNTGQSLVNGGHFRIRCGADGDTLMLRVWDDGPGLPASVVSRLFSPFNSAGKAGGTGLGLALVKQIVDGHGGTIICTTGKGEGTTFDLRFPRAVVP